MAENKDGKRQAPDDITDFLHLTPFSGLPDSQMCLLHHCQQDTLVLATERIPREMQSFVPNEPLDSTWATTGPAWGPVMEEEHGEEETRMALPLTAW